MSLNPITLPDDTISLICEYLKKKPGSLRDGDDKSIMRTAAIGQKWLNNPLLKEERAEATYRLRLRAVQNELIERDYPPEMVQLFRHCHLPIAKLPVLDVSHLTSEEIIYRNNLKNREFDKETPHNLSQA